MSVPPMDGHICPHCLGGAFEPAGWEGDSRILRCMNCGATYVMHPKTPEPEEPERDPGYARMAYLADHPEAERPYVVRVGAITLAHSPTAYDAREALRLYASAHPERPGEHWSISLEDGIHHPVVLDEGVLE